MFIIDGDMVRDFYDNDLGYSVQDRRANIKRILLAAHVLEDCGIFVIVANISPFEDLREFARKKIRGYHQVYLKKDIARSEETDIKGIYKKHLGKTELVGREIPFEEPTNSDLVLHVDVMTPKESLKAILSFMKKECGI